MDGSNKYNILKNINQNEPLMGEPIRKTWVLDLTSQNEQLIGRPIK
jgi:hypothetical protein